MPHRPAPGSAWGLDTELADDWRDLAACRGEDPELFFPIGTSGPALLQVEQAKAVCRRCSVAEQCLAEALRRREMYGIWGGTTEAERAELVRHMTRRGSA
uniref:Transcriptional regulator WhiB n=1 Tax=Thermocrispum agreste TaxID=37925 RepID=A0A2W4JBR7_9PSEU|nr:MAG: WhiB family transcriptional regulator [Thermocrispum agreste]